MKPKAVIKIDGQPVIMDGFYRSIETLEDISIIKGKNEEVIGVENLSDELYLLIFDKYGTPLKLRPGQTYSFGSHRPNRDDLTFRFSDRVGALHYEDEEEELEDERGWDCND